MHNPDSSFYAWLAGFMDGEGCFVIGRVKLKTGRFSYHAAIIISNTYRPVADEIASTLGYGKVHLVAARNGKWREQHQYQASGSESLTLAQCIRPYLRVKIAQADVFLQYPIRAKPKVLHGAISHEDYALREQLFVELKALNARGM